MRIFVTMSVLSLSILPSLAAADCRGHALDQTAASCLPNMVWDDEQMRCVPSPSS